MRVNKIENKKELKKKVIVIEPTAMGSNIVTTTGEVLGETKWHRKPNPNKTDLFFKINKWSEKMSICHYKDNDFLNVFVDGGVHASRFVLTLDDAKKLKDSLVYSIRILCKNRNKLKTKKAD